MPARGTTQHDIPARAFIEVASDPEKYKKALADLTKRKTAAEEAESAARAAVTAAEQAEAAVASAEKRQAEAAERDRKAALDTAEKLTADRARLEREWASYREERSRLVVREMELKSDVAASAALAAELDGQAKALDERAAALARRETAVNGAISIQDGREQAFAAKLADLRSRLEGFSL